MEMRTLNLLILEDHPDDAELAVKELEREGFIVEWNRVDTEKGFREALAGKPDLILVDYSLPSFDGPAALQMHQQIASEIPLIMFSGTIGEEVAAECIKSGAIDYVLKDRLLRLGPAVKRALEEAEAHRERRRMQEQIIHLNSVLKAIRHVNQLVVKEKDRDSLLQKACDILIEARGYDGAWFGFLKDKKTFTRVVVSGFSEDVSRFSEYVVGGDHPPCIKNALTQKPFLMMVDKSKVCGDCFFKSTCIGKEAAIIRIEHDDRFFGLLSILFASDVTADEEEKGLLKEVAGDIAFGLHDMETEKERKRVEEALRGSEVRFKELAGLLPQIVFETDEKGNLIFANRNAFDIFSYTQDDFDKGLTALKMLMPEDRDRGRENIGRVMRGEKPHSAEYMAQRKDGSTFPVIIYSSPIIRENKSVGLRGIIVDITERKQAEEENKKLEAQLRQAQKMEAIGTLAGGIAHDFNNILAAIIGYAEIASLHIGEGEKLKESLKEVLNAGRRARDLVKQILAFSRKGEQERMPVQISPIVKEAMKLLRSSLPTTIEIHQNIESDTGIVEADPTQIHQVLMNLCANAGHAMREEGGVLEVNLQNVDFGLGIEDSRINLSAGPYLRLTVSDTGHGMTPEVLERIFDPYFTTKEKGEGTGLGLAVVHGVVKSHGGTVTAYSEPGKGSTFHVYFPRVEREATTEPEATESLPTGHESILFLDDEATLVEIGKQMLEHLGYEVVTRTSSLEALELFRAKPDEFDLVITDMTMPNMTGDKLAKELMQIRPDIPIILCTGFSGRISVEKAKEIGIRAFVMKPLVMADLAKTVRKALNRIDD